MRITDLPSLAFILSISLFVLVGCGEKPAPKKAKKPHLVDVDIALKKSVSIERERSGTLKALRAINIQNQEEGRIMTMPFYEADKVKKGDVLLKLDDRLLRAQLARTKALRRKAEKDLQRIQELIRKRLVAEAELTQVETELAVVKADEQELLTRLDYAVIRSPIDGVISFREGEQGFIAERYTHLLTVSDQSALITEVTVSELLINKLALGDSVTLVIDALGRSLNDAPLKGRITRIYPDVNPVTRTGTIEIILSPAPRGARPGQLARVMLKTQTAERMLIPFTALRRSAEEDYVFTVDAENIVHKTVLTTGLRVGDEIEVLSGLHSGDRFVVRGFTHLQEKKSVVVVDNSSAQKSTAQKNTAK